MCNHRLRMVGSPASSIPYYRQLQVKVHRYSLFMAHRLVEAMFK